MHAELARFVARGRDHAAFARSADRDRPPTQLRIITLFDGCVERIHVDMDDFARPACLDRNSFRALFPHHLSPLSRWLVRRGFRSRRIRVPSISKRWRRPTPTENLSGQAESGEAEWDAFRRRDVLYRLFDVGDG